MDFADAQVRTQDLNVLRRSLVKRSIEREIAIDRGWSMTSSIESDRVSDDVVDRCRRLWFGPYVVRSSCVSTSAQSAKVRFSIRSNYDGIPITKGQSGLRNGICHVLVVTWDLGFRAVKWDLSQDVDALSNGFSSILLHVNSLHEECAHNSI